MEENHRTRPATNGWLLDGFKKKNSFISELSKWLPIGLALVLTFTFYSAWFEPTHSITLFVNRSGEGFYEAILLPIVWLIILYGLIKPDMTWLKDNIRDYKIRYKELKTGVAADYDKQ